MMMMKTQPMKHFSQRMRCPLAGMNHNRAEKESKDTLAGCQCDRLTAQTCCSTDAGPLSVFAPGGGNRTGRVGPAR